MCWGRPIARCMGSVPRTQISGLLSLPASWDSFDKTLQLSGFSSLSFKMDPLRLVHRTDMRVREKVYERTTRMVKITCDFFMTLQRLYLVDLETGHTQCTKVLEENSKHEI